MKLTPINFQEQWGQPLRKVVFEPRPMLPDETTSFFHFAGLPESVTVGSSRFRFVTTARKLSDVWRKEFDARLSMPHDWNRFWHLGEVEFIQSTAWVCIEELTGRIVMIDVEVSEPITDINSSILLLMTSLKVMLDWHRETGGRMETLKKLTGTLETEVQDNDAEEYWLPYLEYEEESAEDILEVSVT